MNSRLEQRPNKRNASSTLLFTLFSGERALSFDFVYCITSTIDVVVVVVAAARARPRARCWVGLE